LHDKSNSEFYTKKYPKIHQEYFYLQESRKERLNLHKKLLKTCLQIQRDKNCGSMTRAAQDVIHIKSDVYENDQKREKYENGKKKNSKNR
jgi:hypothetical protein